MNETLEVVSTIGHSNRTLEELSVVHLFAPGKSEAHRLRSPVRLEDGRLTYAE